MAVLDTLNWPVSECPQLAGFEVSPEVRIRNLEKMAEEQAKLTRTVESIKDEIAAQAKSRDNRWEFRKDVYAKLITTIHALLKSLHNMADALTLRAGSNPDLRRLRKPI